MKHLIILATATEKRDDETGEHTFRVGQLAAWIAEEMGCDKSFVDYIKIAARLHDIGKIGIT
ncbi:MAG: HD domain-containing protein [Deinococcales bacterium]